MTRHLSAVRSVQDTVRHVPGGQTSGGERPTSTLWCHVPEQRGFGRLKFTVRTLRTTIGSVCVAWHAAADCPLEPVSATDVDQPGRRRWPRSPAGDGKRPVLAVGGSILLVLSSDRGVRASAHRTTRATTCEMFGALGFEPRRRQVCSTNRSYRKARRSLCCRMKCQKQTRPRSNASW